VSDGDLATVTQIIDGDTIDGATGGTTYRVRYIGMDTPERGDYFFSEATEANRAMVEGRQVILVKDVSETDQYGRLLRYVYLEDGTFVNAELVRQGYAVIATFPPDVRHQELFLEREWIAWEAGRELWPQPINSVI
jgi:micrococcal nuclease